MTIKDHTMSQSPNPAATEQVADLLVSAAQFLRAGRPADAIAPLRDAALLQPSNSVILHDLGLACLEVGRIPDAIAALQRAVASNPHYGDAYFRLGIALEKLGSMRGALAAYDRATKLLPALAEAWFRAGALVYTLGHRDEAIACFLRAAVTGGRSSFGRLGKARALVIEDRNQEAEQVLREMLVADPNNAMAYDLLGSVLSELGRFGEARACFERTVAIAPMLAGSYYDLVRCRPIASNDNGLLQAMQAALATPGLEAQQRQRLHLAIGKAAEDLGDYAQAMQHFDAADAVRRCAAPFDLAAFSTEVDRLIARCTSEWIARAPELGSHDATPVLIIGMPRSGTTLVEQIVSMHPEVGAGGELNFWNERGAAWHGSPAGDEKQFVLPEFLAKAAADYLGVLRAIAPKAARVTDKMPFNFLWAGLIHVAFPKATIIHCRRAAVDTALSIHQTFFHPALAFPTGGAELVAYFHSYERLIDHWRGVLPADRFVEVDYEELTRAPEPAIRRIIAACGLPWNDACLRPESNPRAVKTPSKWQTRQPIYRTSVARWKRYEPWLGPLLGLVDNELETDADITGPEIQFRKSW
jgi:Flp pilus assembly protein TadD